VVAHAASGITGNTIGVDPSIGMLKAGPASLPKVQATSEALPFADASFDFITIGFALRHFADLDVVFRECRRVLRAGGRMLILEITAPESRVARTALAAYMGAVVPAVVTAVTFRPRVGRLMRYYWATTRDCVRPETILGALRGAGFDEVKRGVSLAIFSEYSARLPPASRAGGRSESAETREATSPDRRESR
jgi:demethylmenaquinone methyltransferase / 2-methoxy-6-polyprenyl-1,4-benzoquinol methylase